MHLVIISHTAHYYRGNQLVGWGPTVKEINWLAQGFDQVTHVACLHRKPAPESALPYQSPRVTFVPVPPAGGLTLRAKARVLTAAPGYLRAINKILPAADIIQIRCPASIAMVAIMRLSMARQKYHWTKYAGSWVEPQPPLSFRFQRWWLQHGYSQGPVTINGYWPGQPPFIFTFDNPSMSVEDVRKARQIAQAKHLSRPVRLVFAGRTETAKGLHTALEIAQGIARHTPISFDILGDGPERQRFETLSFQLGLHDQVHFHGWVPHAQVQHFMAQAHFVLLPSATEGWPKVLSEAMSYGTVPLASNVSAIPQVLSETHSGVTLLSTEVHGFVDAALNLIEHPARWEQMSRAGMATAPRFTYERYLVHLEEMFQAYYGTPMIKMEVIADLQAQLEHL